MIVGKIFFQLIPLCHQCLAADEIAGLRLETV